MIYNLSELTNIAIDFIAKLSIDLGGRLAGSDKEYEAGNIFVKEARKILKGSDVFIESFNVAPLAFVAWIRPFSALMLFAIVIDNLVPYISLTIAALGIILAFSHILRYSHFFDRLFPQKQSCNCMVEKKYADEDKPLVIMLSGHLDSAYSWPALEKYPQQIRIISFTGVSGVVSLFIFALLRIFGIKLGPVAYSFVKLHQFIAAICLFGFISLDNNKASPGASDNASALGISLAVAKYFEEHPRQNLHLILTAFGSEETGLNGSIDFVKRHGLALDQLRAERRFFHINLDTVAQLDHVHVPAGERFLKVPYSEELVSLLTDGYRRHGVEVSSKLLDIGGVDSIPVAAHGNEAINISCVNYENPSFYHSMKDVLSQIEPDCVAASIHAIIYTVDRLHSKYSTVLRLREDLNKEAGLST